MLYLEPVLVGCWLVFTCSLMMCFLGGFFFDVCPIHVFRRQQFPAHNPLVNFEYYSGWIDVEGGQYPNRRSPTTEAYTAGLDAQLSRNMSVSLYMACGGTNFGFSAGGRWDAAKSTPVIASYDYAAPITEGGDIGPKFLPLQAVIRKHFPATTPPPPQLGGVAPIPKAAYGTVSFDAEALLFENLGCFPTTVLAAPQNMEALMQGYGYILYTTPLPPPSPSPPPPTAPCEGSAGHAVCGCGADGTSLALSCPGAGRFAYVTFASVGTPSGTCPNFAAGKCAGDPAAAVAAVTKLCVGKPRCVVPADINVLNAGHDPCYGVAKSTFVALNCTTAAGPLDVSMPSPVVLTAPGLADRGLVYGNFDITLNHVPNVLRGALSTAPHVSHCTWYPCPCWCLKLEW